MSKRAKVVIEATPTNLGKGPWPKASLVVLLAMTLAAETAADIAGRLTGFLVRNPIDYAACDQFCLGGGVEVTRDSCRCVEGEDE